MTLVLVAYDVNTETKAGKQRLRRVAKLCENYGQRVQNSVFECWINLSDWVVFRGKLLVEVDPERDSLRFYFLGDHWKGRVEHVGAKPGYQPDGPLIV